MVEREPFKLCVVGSIPTGPSSPKIATKGGIFRTGEMGSEPLKGVGEKDFPRLG